MPSTPIAEDYLKKIREHRRSEGNFEALCALLSNAISSAQQNNQLSLATELKEVEEKYAPEYNKAKETNGNAWPEFEKFVSQFEKALTNVQKHHS